MPQMNKGGKFIFGKSLIREGGAVRLPRRGADDGQRKVTVRSPMGCVLNAQIGMYEE